MLTFTTIHFSELSLTELYEAMALRQIVFVVEQACPYLDADGRDQDAYHVFGRDADGVVQAYTRLLKPGVAYPGHPYCSIGRVVNAAAVRGQGTGRALMRYSIAECRRLFGTTPIKIGAQTYLKEFYTELGFVHTGESYLEDGIPHIGMVLE